MTSRKKRKKIVATFNWKIKPWGKFTKDEIWKYQPIIHFSIEKISLALYEVHSVFFVIFLMNFNHEKDASRKPVIHQCGGTLIHLDSGFEGKTNLVVTAAHCFCSLMWSRPGDKENSIIRKNIFNWNFNSKLNKQSNTAEFCSKIQDNFGR